MLELKLDSVNPCQFDPTWKAYYYEWVLLQHALDHRPNRTGRAVVIDLGDCRGNSISANVYGADGGRAIYERKWGRHPHKEYERIARQTIEDFLELEKREADAPQKTPAIHGEIKQPESLKTTPYGYGGY